MSSSLEDCLVLAPGPPCGYKGSCDEVENICVCEKGWSQSTEFALYLSEDEFKSVNASKRLLCDTNNSVLLGLYSFAFAMTLYTFLSHLAKIKRVSQMKRLSPFLLGYLCTLFYCCLRIENIDRKLGQDLITTLLLAASFGVEKKAFKASHLKKVQNFIVVVDVASTLCLVASAFSDSWTVDVTVLKLFLGLVTARMVYSIWADIYYVNLILFDIKQLFLLAANQRTSTDQALTENTKVLNKLRENIKGLKLIKNTTVAFNLAIVTFYIPSLVWPRFLSVFKYFIPLAFASGGLTALIVLLAHNAKNRGLKFSTDSSQLSTFSSKNQKSSGITKPASSIQVNKSHTNVSRTRKKSSISKPRVSKKRSTLNRTSKKRSTAHNLRGTLGRTLGRKTSKEKVDERVDMSLLNDYEDDDS